MATGCEGRQVPLALVIFNNRALMATGNREKPIPACPHCDNCPNPSPIPSRNSTDNSDADASLESHHWGNKTAIKMNLKPKT